MLIEELFYINTLPKPYSLAEEMQKLKDWLFQLNTTNKAMKIFGNSKNAIQNTFKISQNNTVIRTLSSTENTKMLN